MAHTSLIKPGILLSHLVTTH